MIGSQDVDIACYITTQNYPFLSSLEVPILNGHQTEHPFWTLPVASDKTTWLQALQLAMVFNSVDRTRWKHGCRLTAHRAQPAHHRLQGSWALNRSEGQYKAYIIIYIYIYCVTLQKETRSARTCADMCSASSIGLASLLEFSLKECDSARNQLSASGKL